MPLVISSQPAGPRFSITAEAEMPTIVVTAALQNQPMPSGAAPIYEWSATLAFDGSSPATNATFGGGRSTQHSRIAPQVSANASWRIPFTEIRGGVLTVQVILRAGGTERSGDMDDCWNQSHWHGHTRLCQQHWGQPRRLSKENAPGKLAPTVPDAG